MNLDTIPRSPSGEFTREKLIDDLRYLLDNYRVDDEYGAKGRSLVKELIESLEMGKLGV